jgi:hypothetical protein
MDDLPECLRFDYSKKSDLELARHINLALLICGGISEVNAGFDTVVTLNDAGIAKIAQIIGKIRAASCAPAA